MVDEFFLQSLIQITHGEIRLIDNDRKIRRIGQTNEDEDPFFTDPNFLNDVLERRPEASIDVFWEDDVYYARVRRKTYRDGFLRDQFRQLLVQHLRLKSLKSIKLKQNYIAFRIVN